MNKKLIKEMEGIFTIKDWLRNTNSDIEVINFHDTRQVIKRENLLNEYREFLSYYQNNWDFRIFGSEVEFDMKVYNVHQLIKICKDIWENPEKYYGREFESGESSYYEFLKFLWVKARDGQEFRLGDIALNYENCQELLKEVYKPLIDKIEENEKES